MTIWGRRLPVTSLRLVRRMPGGGDSRRRAMHIRLVGLIWGLRVRIVLTAFIDTICRSARCFHSPKRSGPNLDLHYDVDGTQRVNEYLVVSAHNQRTPESSAKSLGRCG
jgi:hypothetical protein